jgi:hypothetical protein
MEKLLRGVYARTLRTAYWRIILSRIHGSVTNNNGFSIGWLDLLTPSFTITLHRNQYTIAHNKWLPKTRSILTWLRLSSLLVCLLLTYEWIMNDSSGTTECVLSLSLILRPRVSRPVFLEIKHPSGAYDQIFITVRQLRVCWFGALSLTTGRFCRLQFLLAFWVGIAQSV